MKKLVYEINANTILNNILNSLVDVKLANYSIIPNGESSRVVVYYLDTPDETLYNNDGFLRFVIQQTNNELKFYVSFKKDKQSTTVTKEFTDLPDKFKELNLDKIGHSNIPKLDGDDILRIKNMFNIEDKLNSTLTLAINDYTFYLQYITMRLMYTDVGAKFDFKIMASTIVDMNEHKMSENHCFLAFFPDSNSKNEAKNNENIQSDIDQGLKAFKSVMENSKFKTTKLEENFYQYLMSQYKQKYK